MRPDTAASVSHTGHVCVRKRLLTRTGLARPVQAITRSTVGQQALERGVALTGTQLESPPQGMRCMPPVTAPDLSGAAVRRRCWCYMVNATETPPVNVVSNWRSQTWVTRTARAGTGGVFTARVSVACGSRHVVSVASPVASHESAVPSDGASRWVRLDRGWVRRVCGAWRRVGSLPKRRCCRRGCGVSRSSLASGTRGSLLGRARSDNAVVGWVMIWSHGSRGESAGISPVGGMDRRDS